jgi:DNA polymerase II small subunit
MGGSQANEAIEWLIDRGLLLSPEITTKLSNPLFVQKLKTFLDSTTEDDPFTLNEKILALDDEETSEVEEEKEVVEEEVNSEEKQHKFNVEIEKSYDKLPSDKKMIDFVKFFNARYKALEQMISSRAQMQGRISIGRLKNKDDRQMVSIVGLVKDKEFTKNGHLILTMEDPTGSFKVLISKTKADLFNDGSELTLDEVIGVVGTTSKTLIFATEIIWPEVPFMELKKGEVDEYAIFLSDIHIGSKDFLGKELDRFIKWLNGEVGSPKNKMIASKVKYVFIAGDLVAGVGIYPSQYDDLVIKDIHEQYNAVIKLIDQIPKDKAVIISPGNHDAMRMSEPQPRLPRDLVEDLYHMENVFLVSNPAYVNIAKTDTFPGFNVLVYHGYCFDYYVANIEYIRNSGGYDRADLIMKFLLKRRHLAPSYSSTLYVVDPEKDNLVIEQVPDIFLTGHIHKSALKNHRNITLVCGSCWESKTAFQEKVGHNPEPCRVPIIHLKSRKMKILKFIH